MHTLDQLRSGELDGIKELHLNAGLSTFPKEIYRLADSLEVLNLSGNQLSELPDDFDCLKNLKAVFFFNNCFKQIPAVLAKCKLLDIYGFRYNQIDIVDPKALGENLRWLILTGNRISQISAGMGRFKKLQKCMLAGNELTELPDDMQLCENLALLRISSNKLKALPHWLLKMPRLSWLAYAGNPCVQSKSVSVESLPPVDWLSLEVKEQLGQGASGVISKAQFEGRDVALKLFKASMTSDGSPGDELNASVLAANHNNLIGLLGHLVNHPDGKHGLLMDLIPAEFSNLAQPPSLASCTRDIYDTEQAFSFDEVVNILKGIASVAAHLHSKGVLHGDLYPHNILVSPAGESLLTDFGAATIYEAGSDTVGALQQIEVCAYGYIMEDLLDRLDVSTLKDQSIVEQLQSLKAQCLSTDVSSRPLFNEISELLNTLA